MTEEGKEYTLQHTLPALVDAQLSVEKIRVREQVRQTHLAKLGRRDEETDRLVEKLKEVEEYINKRVAVHITAHPAYPWFSRVKGIGKENIAKVVGSVRIKPYQGYRKAKDSEELVLIELPYADTISSLWKFAGFSVEDGKAPKREGGKKLTYNSQLRSMCWRLGVSLMRAGGKFYEYYGAQKQKYVERYSNEGIKIMPVNQLPKKNNKYYEPEGVISEGHVHNQALRKMIKLFLACLWLEWRKGLGLPETKPYVIDKLGHESFISPETMCDK